ncbi:hypothetical protein ALP51_02836 [Pseudomonas savastanoi]|uniref:Uncharacterized protein n=1 Tax=Pseudomonas savastanoi TaxID=29438 RepID=A0A3M5KDB5_PSESS|nr:hypothetical protein ALP51_02836 [Pseudomonas savastanoi]
MKMDVYFINKDDRLTVTKCIARAIDRQLPSNVNE